MNNKKSNIKLLIIAFLAILVFVLIKSCESDNILTNLISKNTIKILSSYENAQFESSLQEYAKKEKINIELSYMSDLDIVDELNNYSENYDAVWIANSMWLYMLDNSYLTSDSKSISISPIVIGIRKSKAKELGLIGKDITNDDFIKLVQDKKISYVMNSVTSTNAGATAYFGFLESLAGNPEVLTKDILDDTNLQNELVNLFSGVERVSGDENYLESMFVNDDSYEAVIASETSLISMNKKLKEEGKEELYLFYPSDGVAVNDSTFAFINNDQDKEETFLSLQSFLLSEEGQKKLQEYGYRTWYGGTNENVNKKVFNPDWGIDTTKYLNVTKFPSKDVITYALNIYIEMLRKPSHVVFVLDYSGSMYGDGLSQMSSAMNYILSYEEASKDKLQFSKKDKITIVPFSTEVHEIFSTDNGHETNNLINRISEEETSGATALYDGIIKALEILDKEEDTYTKTVIAMTDGVANVGSFYSLMVDYEKRTSNIPIYSITFGNAKESELEKIANLSNAKVFDGKTDLISAFKEVRGYN